MRNTRKSTENNSLFSVFMSMLYLKPKSFSGDNALPAVRVFAKSLPIWEPQPDRMMPLKQILLLVEHKQKLSFRKGAGAFFLYETFVWL